MRLAVRGAIALAALAIAWAFLVTVLRHTRPMGLPLDDSYLALTSWGSVAWRAILAPLWLVGIRGHALIWAAFVGSAVLYAVTALTVHRIVERIAGGVAAVVAAVLVLAIAPFAWHALAAGGAALAAALLVAMLGQLLAAPATGAPPRRLAVYLAATVLAWPAAIPLVVAICAIAAARRIRERSAAAWWLAPLIAPLAWLVVTRGRLPGLAPQAGSLVRGLFWDPDSPLVWPRLFAVLWLAGAVRVVGWARRERRGLAGGVILAAPFAVMLASSAPWSAGNDRAIAAALPLLAITAGCALAPPRSAGRRGRLAIAGLALALVTGFAVAAIPRLAGDARLYAQGVIDSNAQVVAAGEYVSRKLPGARVMTTAPGAISYYSDAEVIDLGGSSDRHQTAIASEGPGALFEQLEALPPDRRPTHFAIYPDALGTGELFGEVVLHTAFQTSRAPSLDPRRLLAGADLQLISASWDHAGTGERPLGDHTGWAVVDRIDIADLASEAAHAWAGALVASDAPRRSMVSREALAHGLVIDGGRTIRGGSESFTIAADPGKPIRLVLRTGGSRAIRLHDPIDHPVPLRILDSAGREVARATLPPTPADGGFAEVAFALPAGTPRELHSEASSPYRAFHWFVLQPE